MHLMVSPDLQPNHFIFQGHCERFNPNVNPKSSDSDLRFSNGIHSVLFPLHFKSFIVLIFPLPLFSLHLFSLPAYTSAFLVVPYGLWFADSAARQRSWKVTWDKSCFSALRADIFQLCSALLPSDSPNMLAGGLGRGEGGRRRAEGWYSRTPHPAVAVVKTTLPCEEVAAVHDAPGYCSCCLYLIIVSCSFTNFDHLSI